MKGENYGKNWKHNGLKVITPRENRLILRCASNSCLTANEIRVKNGVKASVATVKGVISNDTWKSVWNKVVFSDEKKN